MAPRKQLPSCFACGKNPVDATSFTNWQETDEALCVSCQQLDNPFNKPDSCQPCSLYRRPGPVKGRGKTTSGMMGIAEAPGIDEVYPRVMSTLVGGSGRIYDRLCQLAGTNSWFHFTTNVVKCRPPRNRTPNDHEIRCCAPILIKEINAVNPNLLLALGDTALYTLTGRTGISKHRGVPIPGPKGPDGKERKVLATFHPAWLMRLQNQFPLVVHDVSRALEQSKFPDIRRVELRYVTNGREGFDREAIIRRCLESGVSVEDLETIGAGGTLAGALDFRTLQIVCCGIGHAVPGEATCYPWDDRVKEVITTIHLDPRIEKVGQNCEQFDWDALWHNGVPEPVGKSFDTMNAEHLVSPDTPKDLGTLGANYTDMEYWKDGAKKNLFYYNCQDIDGTGRGYIELKRGLKDLDMEWLYYHHVMPLQPCLRRMRRAGVKKDMTTAAKLRIVLSRKADEMEKMLRDALGRPALNVNSPKEMMKLLYEDMGLPVQYKRTKEGNRPTADADALEKLVELFPDQKTLALVSQIRTIRSKWIATYIDVAADENHFVHPSIGSAKAANGRMNSWHPNGQNIPEFLRQIYVPDDDDHVWIEADWGQIEYRLAMILSGDEKGLQLMTSGFEIFKATAADVLGKKIELVQPNERQEMKFFIYGLFYGRGVESIASALGWEMQRAQTWIDGIAATYPTFWAWRQNIPKKVRRDNYLVNPYGRRRFWFTNQGMTEALNFPASSTAADMMYDAVVASDAQLPKGATNRLTVHDALSVVSHRDVAKEAYHALKEIMLTAQHRVCERSDRPDVVRRYYPNGWSCPVEAHIGRSWLEAKKGNKELEKEILG